MGIKLLNSLIKKRCGNMNNLISLYRLKGKIITIDISIYLYRFKSVDKLMENMYILCSLMCFFEIKPLFKRENLLHLIKLTKRTKKYGLISFKEKNLINLYKINKKLPLGLLFLASTSFKKIKIKSKKKYVKFLVIEKKFLSNKNLNLIKKRIYYYTIKNKSLFKKYRHRRNLIFENL